jgi:hypothetical protein
LNIITKEKSLEFVLQKFKEGKLSPEKTLHAIEMLYDPKTTFPQFQRFIRKEIGDIMPLHAES